MSLHCIQLDPCIKAYYLCSEMLVTYIKQETKDHSSAITHHLLTNRRAVCINYLIKTNKLIMSADDEY